MSIRFHAARVLSRRKIFETFIGPGYYIALTAGLLASYFLINGFIQSIDSSGLNYSLHPLYSAIGSTMVGAFGDTMVEKLFLEGPFLLILYVFLIPIILFLSFNSVFRFGLEKKAGAVELVSYGPADGTSYFLAVFIKDFLFCAISIGSLFVLSLAASAANNLVLGPQFLFSLVTALLVSGVIFAYGILATSFTDNSGSAVILFLAIIAFFLIILAGSMSVAGGYVRNLFETFSWILKWISPFYYWGLCLRAVETGNVAMYILGSLLLIGLTLLILFVSHLIFKVKGVRS